MKMSDISTGSDWMIWILIVFLVVISAVLVSGHGGWFIAGYNMASQEEKEKYDSKKLCRTVGFGMTVITALIIITMLFEGVLPEEFSYIMIGIILVDAVIMNILAATICRKK